MWHIGQLWLPILLSAVFCFIASAVIWMAGPHHKKEWKGLKNEDAVLDALRQGGVEQGGYLFPFGDRSNKEAFEAAMKKFAEGPGGVMYVFPRGRMGMGKMLVQQFIYFLLIASLVAVVTRRAVEVGAPYPEVFKFAGSLALMTLFMGTIPESIWFGRPWKSAAMQLIDSLVYAGLLAGTFGWLWPR